MAGKPSPKRLVTIRRSAKIRTGANAQEEMAAAGK